MAKQLTNTRGFSVLEMILVLALVATALALVLPAVLKPLARTELDQAAKQVRNGLHQARAAAIGSGVPHEFRYQPGGRRWEVYPQASQQNTTPSAFSAAAPSDPHTSDFAEPTAADPNAQPVIIEEQLPAGVVFADPWDREPKFTGEDFSHSASTEESPADSWAPAIVFYPNGRTSDQRIRLLGANETYVDVTLRGLTGMAFIGEISRLARVPAATGPMVVTEELLP